VDTPEEMRRALAERGPWDVVLSDWRMPRFSGIGALEISREAESEAPFIIVSGKVGEEAAVEAMKAGAHDYVMKDNLTRLCATVERGLEEAQARRERERAEKSLQESEERYRRLVELSPDTIIVHARGEVLFINTAGAALFGAASPEELTGRPVMDFIHSDYREIVRARIIRSQEEGERADLIQEKFLRLDGQTVDVEAVATPVTYRGQAASLHVQRVQPQIREHLHGEVAVEGLLADRAQEHGLLGHGGQGGGGGQGVDRAGQALAGGVLDVAGDPGHELAPDLVQDPAQLGVLDRRLGPEGDQVGVAVVEVGEAFARRPATAPLGPGLRSAREAGGPAGAGDLVGRGAGPPGRPHHRRAR
jgi:PAS domain S-box-containing protein